MNVEDILFNIIILFLLFLSYYIYTYEHTLCCKEMKRAIFGIADYTIFVIFLISSLFIGVYFSFFGTKIKTVDQYLYGGKKMNTIPVGLSLFSSALSAISIIGIPIEVYNFGTGFLTGIIGIAIGCFVIWIVVLPIFCGNLTIKTPYEYFEQRFDNKVKLLSLFIYILRSLLMMPAIIYAPSLALSQMTQVNVLIYTTIIGGICILYTTFGGFKTVIWTDSLQAILMLLACLFIAISGTMNAGGISKVWKFAEEGNRITFFNMDPNPFVRITFWPAVLGVLILHIGHAGTSASALQRYMSLPSENQAKLSTIIAAFGAILIQIIGGITGLAMYAIYRTCDPLMNNEISNPNQLVPYFVAQTLDYIPGFSGFFIAGLISAALSTLSSDLNVVGGMIYYDFLVKFCKNNFIQNRGTFIIKIIVFMNGIIYLLLIPLIQNSAHIYELIVGIGSITHGPTLGILLLGILFPKCNSKGAFIGAVTSLALVCWIQFGATYYKVNSYYKLPTNVNNCTNPYNITTSISSLNEEKMELNDIFILYRISYLYICLISTLITFVVGILVSFLIGGNNLQEVDPVLISPFLRSHVMKNKRTEKILLRQKK